MRKLFLLFILVLTAAAIQGQTEETPSLLRIAPTFSMGWPVTDQFSQLYGPRTGYGFQMLGIPAGRPGVAWALSAEYRSTTLKDGSETLLEVVRPEIGLQVRAPLGERAAVFVQGLAGYGGARLSPAPAGISATRASGLTYRAGAGGELVLGNLYAFADVTWDSFRTLYSGVSGRVGVGLQFGGRGSRGTTERRQVLPAAPQPLSASAATVDSVDLGFSLSLEPVFPVLYKYYDNEPIGTVSIRNDGDAVAEDVEIRLDMETYIDNPKLSATIQQLAPGEEVQVPLFALFNEAVRSITEGDKVAAVVRADYEVAGESIVTEETVTVDFYDRNAIKWDDDRKVAAFVTARDEQIRPLASNLSAIAREQRRDAVSANFQLGLMMYLSMVELGLEYRIDPNSSYAVLSQDALVIDSVQFPRQTFAYRGGDCDDLSVAYAALLESVGVPTAFVTHPGHIYLAFGLDMTADLARDTFRRPDDLIFLDDGSVWVPVEITLLEDEFAVAWDTGARQWRQYNGQGQAGFFPTADAWQTYQPVAYTGREDVRSVDGLRLEDAFNREMVAFVKREIADRELGFKARLEQDPDNVRIRNRLGVLYAQYGLTDAAVTEFRMAVATQPYAPALANLGNVAFLAGELAEAERLFEQALAEDADNATALLGMARTNHELENYGLVQRYFDRLRSTSPAVALEYSYLELRGEEAARASDAARLGDRVLWNRGDDE